MKRFFITLILSLAASSAAFSCDQAIEKFARDCSLQDRLSAIRKTYAAQGINVDEIGEYKALRFIDRNSWEKSKRLSITPLNIYDPAPITWKIWEGGIDSILKSPPELNKETFAKINTVLLTDGTTSIKDKITDQSKMPGEFRAKGDKTVGFCVDFGRTDMYRTMIRNSEISMERYLTHWETETGVRFSDVVKKENGPDPRDANMNAEIRMTRDSCGNGSGMSVYYSPSKDVKDQIEWIRIFIKTNLEAFQQNNAKIAPVELAAVVQKWFVSIHPFADGNGRTSRAVQDLIMHNFALPFVPGGDLQNDATEEVEIYIENTYKSLELMLSVLEQCVDQRSQVSIPRACRTISELNSGFKDFHEIENEQYQPRP
ncbi:hypothetical protein CIK05_08425 [Bdellovibrio sp. qaytius]|nr:hypothetical protein CIK05_08425 [Bdellovibrio sp. qaytius]